MLSKVFSRSLRTYKNKFIKKSFSWKIKKLSLLYLFQYIDIFHQVLIWFSMDIQIVWFLSSTLNLKCFLPWKKVNHFFWFLYVNISWIILEIPFYLVYFTYILQNLLNSLHLFIFWKILNINWFHIFLFVNKWDLPLYWFFVCFQIGIKSFKMNMNELCYKIFFNSTKYFHLFK